MQRPSGPSGSSQIRDKAAHGRGCQTFHRPTLKDRVEGLLEIVLGRFRPCLAEINVAVAIDIPDVAVLGTFHIVWIGRVKVCPLDDTAGHNRLTPLPLGTRFRRFFAILFSFSETVFPLPTFIYHYYALATLSDNFGTYYHT